MGRENYKIRTLFKVYLYKRLTYVRSVACVGYGILHLIFFTEEVL